MANVDKIKALAKEQGLKISYICSRLGFTSRTYFQDIQKHNREIPDDKLKIIADILHTTPEYLKDETDIKEAPHVQTDAEREKVKAILDMAKDLPDDEIDKVLDYIDLLISRRNFEQNQAPHRSKD